MKVANRLRRLLNDERGQAAALATVCLGMLMSVMALAVDVAYMHYRQGQLQTAADSAAIAAGLELSNCSNTVCANMKNAAEQALIEDGITTSTVVPTSNCSVSTSSGLAMIINVAPCVLGSTTKDPNYGNTNMAEVVLTESQGMFFGNLFGIHNFNLVARAEAGQAYLDKPADGFCVWSGSVTINGSATVDLQSCGWYDNGNLSPNSGDNVTAQSMQYYGTWENPANCGTSPHYTCTWTLNGVSSQPSHTTTSVADPLANLATPSQPATQDANNCSISNMDCWGHNVVNHTVNAPPGYYGGGINVNSGITLNLSPGLYYFNGSLNVDSATLECTTCTGGAGVTLYFESGVLQMNSSSNVTLNAPATGDTSNSDIANVLVFQARNNSSGMDVDASSTSALGGIIYLPDAELTVNSGPNMTALALDTQSIMVDGNFTINGSNNLLGPGSSDSTTLNPTFALAE